jgi:ribosomal protein L37AE/L43A
MTAPNGSQKTLQTVTQWRHCAGCNRAAPMRRLAGDTCWQCPWCGYHDPEPIVQAVQASAKQSETSHGQ